MLFVFFFLGIGLLWALPPFSILTTFLLEEEGSGWSTTRDLILGNIQQQVIRNLKLRKMNAFLVQYSNKVKVPALTNYKCLLTSPSPFQPIQYNAHQLIQCLTVF